MGSNERKDWEPFETGADTFKSGESQEEDNTSEAEHAACPAYARFPYHDQY